MLTSDAVALLENRGKHRGDVRRYFLIYPVLRRPEQLDAYFSRLPCLLPFTFNRLTTDQRLNLVGCL